MLGAADLLEFWERAGTRSPHHFAQALLELALPESDRVELFALSIGERDRLLCQLRQSWFGSEFESSNACDTCQTPIEANLNLSELCNSISAAQTKGEISWKNKDIPIQAPCCSDALEWEDQESSNNTQLIEAACRHFFLGKIVSNSLPKSEIEDLQKDSDFGSAIETKLEEIDPFASVWIEMQCPECQAQQSYQFDPVFLLRYDIRKWVENMMEDIHLLASRYAWKEADIVRLPSNRRIWYRERLLK